MYFTHFRPTSTSSLFHVPGSRCRGGLQTPCSSLVVSSHYSLMSTPLSFESRYTTGPSFTPLLPLLLSFLRSWFTTIPSSISSWLFTGNLNHYPSGKQWDCSHLHNFGWTYPIVSSLPSLTSVFSPCPSSSIPWPSSPKKKTKSKKFTLTIIVKTHFYSYYVTLLLNNYGLSFLSTTSLRDLIHPTLP